MAYDVVYANEARLDRDEMVSYLVRRLSNRGAARRFLNDLDALIVRLESTPFMYPVADVKRLGRTGEYRKASLRSGYVVLYCVIGTTVAIARIFNARQDYARFV